MREDDSYALILRGSRSIGDIIPDVVIEETHDDRLAITLHPVERGAAISDHAFLLPKTLEMRCGWSDSTAGSVGYVQEVYEELRALQAEREEFDVFTGKRAYSNMLIAGISVVTDEKSEHALMVVCRLQEIIVTDTESAAPQSAQAQPQKTASTVNKATQQLRQGFATPSQRE